MSYGRQNSYGGGGYGGGSYGGRRQSDFGLRYFQYLIRQYDNFDVLL
ncbi:MAG: hypothetical protein M3156_02390 [Thermoproteota archaeon]|nr:hypothetical protein [Thermoproteota archaeon]